MVERLVDLVARKLKMDPAEIRKKNFIPPFTDGHTVATGLTYDSGNYRAAFDKALGMLDYAGLRKKQAELRQKGEHLGIGISTYAEICGLGPSQVAGAVGLRRRPLGERDRPLPPLRKGRRHGRHLAARPGRGDDLRADRRERARRPRRRRRGRPRRHRAHADGLGLLRQPLDAGGQRSADGRDREDPREGQDRHGAPARGRSRGHRLRRRQVLREGNAFASSRRSRTWR